MNIDDVCKMLEYARYSYKNSQPISCSEKIYFLENENVQCWIRKIKSELIIVFRGTDSFKDFLTDINFWKKSIPYDNISSKIRIHSGFLDAYINTGTRCKIQNFLTQEIEKIKITGHSFGAALSILCAIDLQYNFPEKDYEVVLFGCPRVGNNAFRKSYDSRIFKTLRIENKGDFVTKLPFAFMGFRHVGNKISIGKTWWPKIFCKNHRIQIYYSKIWNKMLK